MNAIKTKIAATTSIFGPEGNLLTPANLPSPNTVRWVSRRKAELVSAVRGGLLTLDEACERYSISPEEYFNWRDAMARFGMVGLRATNVDRIRGNGRP